jgi:hypothetical protein
MNTQPDDLPTTAADMARSDFFWAAEKAFSQAGGGSWATFKGKTLEEFAQIAAHNGLRITYDARKHMDHYQQLLERLN